MALIEVLGVLILATIFIGLVYFLLAAANDRKRNKK